MSAVRDHYHTIQIVVRSDERLVRFGYPDRPSWEVQVYCSLAKSAHHLATFSDEKDATAFAHTKAVELEIAMERLPQ